VLLVRVASTAVATRLLGGSRDRIVAALSHAWLDGGALRAYRHAPNTGPRKSWAAGDAASRAVRLALMAVAGEPGYPSPLTAPVWGFAVALARGDAGTLARPLGAHVLEDILLKIASAAASHPRRAGEASPRAHPGASPPLP